MPAHTISKPLIPLVFFLSSSFSQSIRAVRYNVCTAYKLLCSDNHSKQQINQLTEPNQSAPPILNRRDRQLALCFGQLFIFIVHFTTCYTLCLLIRNWCFRWHTDLSHLLLNIPYRTHCTLHTTYIHNFKLQCIFGHKNNLHWVNIQTKLLLIHIYGKKLNMDRAGLSPPFSISLWIVVITKFGSCECCQCADDYMCVNLSLNLSLTVYVVRFLFTLPFTWRYLRMKFHCVCFFGQLFSRTLFIIFIWMGRWFTVGWERERERGGGGESIASEREFYNLVIILYAQ